MPIDDVEKIFQDVPADESQITVIKSMLSSENPIMHTEIPNPLALTKLRMWEQLFGKMHYYRCAVTVKTFCDKFELNMISYDRKRAGEVERMISAVNAAQHQQQVTENKWFGPGEEKK